jgi:hypothetical protein
LPPASLLGLIIPQLGAFHEWVIYPGILISVLAIIAQPWQDNARRDRFWIVVLFISILIALGSAVPGLYLLAGLPGFSQLRVPPRALFLASLAFAWLAAFGFQALLEVRVPVRTARLTALAAFTATAAFFLVGWITNGTFWKAAGLAAALVLAFLILVQIRTTKRISITSFAYALLALIALVLLFVDASLVRYEPQQQVLGEDQAIAQFIGQDSELFRVYSPSYSLAQQTAADYGIQLTNGVDPLQLRSYAAFMAAASGVPVAGYSVALPPLAGEPATANAAYAPDAKLLGLLNVKYLVSEFPLNTPDLEEIGKLDRSFVYLNQSAMSRAWVEDTGGVREVDGVRSIYNETTVAAQGPGRLVVSEIFYPGWQASIDGQPAKIEPYHDILRSIELPTGNHTIEFHFKPPLLYLGLLLTAFTLTYIARTKERS